MVRGSCLCGNVTWQATGAFEMMAHCHCSMCRKYHGAAFSTPVATEAEGFRWLSGKDSFSEYESSPAGRKYFCNNCGSPLPGRAAGGRVFMPAGCLDDDPGVRPLAHLFTASKAPWHTISDSLPQFDAYPPGLGDEVKRDAPDPPTRAGAIRGSCLCGDVAFELDEKPVTLVYCHCSRCRKTRGTAHNANVFIPVEQFRWVRGEQGVRDYRPPGADRFTSHFCETCGSTLPRPGREDSRAMAVPAGALDDDPGVRPAFHFFCASKAPWFEITGDLPRFDEAPPGGTRKAGKLEREEP